MKLVYVARKVVVVVFVFFMCANVVFAQADDSHEAVQKQTADQQELIEASRALSRAMLVDGDGWKAYGSFLHAEFSRWSVGQEVTDRDSTVKLIREWWENGNRQSSSEAEIISVQITDATAVIRKRVTEKYLDAEGNDAGSFSGYVFQVWIRQNDGWKLFSATMQKGD